MGVMLRIIIAATCLGAAALFQNYRLMAKPLKAPEFDFNEYWGPGKAENYKENKDVKPFDITAQPEVSMN